MILVGVAYDVYQIATSKNKAAAIGARILQEGESIAIGAAGIWFGGGTIAATTEGLLATSGVGALVMASAGIGWAIGQGVNGIVIGDKTVTDHLADFILWTGVFGPFDQDPFPFQPFLSAPSIDLVMRGF